MKKPLVILAGPTAAGKSSLSIALAKLIGGEIISADSMQVYRGMDIGSAKITAEEMEGIPHHMIDIIEPYEEFNVSLFKDMAGECAQKIYSNGHIPIVVGGTGFYIQALLYDVDFTEEEKDRSYRLRLEEMAVKEGNEILYERLKEIDPASAKAIHPNNTKRLIRALEYHHLTGEPISVHNETMKNRPSPYSFCYFVLYEDRKKLYEKTDLRVDRMMEQGLMREVSELKEKGVIRSMTSMQGLGYREIYDHLNGDYSLDEAVRLIKRNTRHYAKRQMTWFRREKDVIMVNRGEFEDEEKIVLFMKDVIKERTGWEK